MKLLKKLMVRFRKADKKYKSKNSRYGDITTEPLCGFVVRDSSLNDEEEDSNFIVYQISDNDNDESVNELVSLSELLSSIGIKNVKASSESKTVLIISASIREYNKLNSIYLADYKLAYHKHLKSLFNFLTEYKIINSEEPLEERFNVPAFPFSNWDHSADYFVMSNIDGYEWKNLIDEFNLSTFQILSLISIYYNAASFGFEDTPIEYVPYNMTNAIDFLYDYTYIWMKCVKDRVDELNSMLSDDFKIRVYNKNIFDLNLFSNPSDESSLYDDIDEIID